jgi:NAD(P)-dependent dehydrogenase (short-subunit alcohol dehydrogenase family)
MACVGRENFRKMTDSITPSARLKGKVTLVTGAANGIGRGCALAFAQHGANVVAIDRDVEQLNAAAAQAQAAGAPFTVVQPMDLLDEAAISALIERVTVRFGALHGVVNAAAAATFAWIEDLTTTDWRQTLSAELDTVFFVTRAAWPLLKRSGGASVINFASANAYHALEGSPALAHCAGKGGVLAMTRQLAMEGGAHGIRANTISPGFIQTAATNRHLQSDPRLRDKVLAKNMIKRLGTPEDVALCALWLASDESTYVTGSDISIDAGATAW